MATGQTSKPAVPQRRLEQAAEYVSRTWFPVNPEIFALIQATLSQGKYENNTPALIQDIKKDFAIFTYCLKGIKDLYPPDLKDKNPLSALKRLDQSVIRALLSVPSSEISSHDFKEMDKSQSARLKHLVLSASAAELLAAKNSVNPDEVYTLSVLRQLGLSLIAWNYPSIYNRAVQVVRNGSEDELEAILTEQLGFSPRELAAELTLPVEVRIAMSAEIGLNESGTEDGEVNVAESLPKKLCEIGEAFAVLNDPENHPTGTQRSKTVITEINQILGPNGVNLIREVVNRRYVTYVNQSPETFAVGGAIEDNIQKASHHHGTILLAKNAFVGRVPPELQARIRETYSLVPKGAVSTEGIQLLATKVMPEAGFHRGCVYLLDQKKMVLIPKLRIGTDQVSRHRSYSCLDEANTGVPVVDAYFTSYPVKQENCMMNGDYVHMIAGVIGVAERAGVLYLEMTDELVANHALDPLGMFKALRQCLNDCLNLR